MPNVDKVVEGTDGFFDRCLSVRLVCVQDIDVGKAEACKRESSAFDEVFTGKATVVDLRSRRALVRRIKGTVVNLHELKPGGYRWVEQTDRTFVVTTISLLFHPKCLRYIKYAYFIIFYKLSLTLLPCP